MNPITWLKGLGVGAAIMYFADPDKGERRRTEVRDSAVRVVNDLGDALDSKTRELQGQAQNLLSQAGTKLKSEPGIAQAAGALSVTPGRWSPATRALLSLSGGYVALKGAKLGGWLGLLTSATGVAMVVRGLADFDAPTTPTPPRPRLIDTPPFLNDPVSLPTEEGEHSTREAGFRN